MRRDPTRRTVKIRLQKGAQRSAPHGEGGAEEDLTPTREQLQQLVSHIREVFFISTPEPVRVTYLSPAYEEIWGRPREEVYQRPAAWIESIHPEDRKRAIEVFTHSQWGEPTRMEYRIVRPDGATRWISNRTFPVRDSAGRFYQVVGIAEDITDYKRIEHTLRESLGQTQQAQERLAVALHESQERARESAVLAELVDLLQSSRQGAEAYKIAATIFRGLFFPGSGALCITSSSRNLVEAVATWGDRRVTEQTFDPNSCWALRRGKIHIVKGPDSPMMCEHVRGANPNEYVCVPLAAQGETLGVLCIEGRPEPLAASGKGSTDEIETLVRRATAAGERLSLAVANLHLREVLRRQSIRDPLTNLFNRRYMEESVERELHRGARNHEPVAFLMIDLDHFKQFNDRFGHQAGDSYLRAVGEFLRERTRGLDLVCRYGGEEFLIVLPGASAEDTRQRAEAWREEFKSLTVQHVGQALGGISLSIGIAVFPDHGETLDALIRAADQMLYKAKAEGRDRVLVAMGTHA
ncbi:MAG TPA: diguanylate cyclase [bacterium]|nr:diguanylate cyclase [bacterium]